MKIVFIGLGVIVDLLVANNGTVLKFYCARLRHPPHARVCTSMDTGNGDRRETMDAKRWMNVWSVSHRGSYLSVMPLIFASTDLCFVTGTALGVTPPKVQQWPPKPQQVWQRFKIQALQRMQEIEAEAMGTLSQCI